MKKFLSSKHPLVNSDLREIALHDFAMRVSVAFFSNALEIDKPTDIYIHDQELEYIRSQMSLLSSYGVVIEEEVEKRYHYVMYVETLKRLYNKAVLAEETEEEDNPIKQEEYAELLKLQSAAKSMGVEIDEEQMLMLNTVETRFIFGESLSFANLIAMRSPESDYMYIIFENKSIKAAQTTNLRADVLATVKKHCQDRRIFEIETIDSDDRFNAFIKLCKDNGIIIITGVRKDGDIEIDFYCPEELSEFQRSKIIDLDTEFSILGDKSKGVIDFLDRLKDEKMKHDRKGYKKVSKLGAKYTFGH